MKVRAGYFISILLLLFFITGCSSTNNVSEDVFQFKDSYVGDNSAVGGIINQIPYAEYNKGFELETTEEPYGVVIEYDKEQEEPVLNDEDMKELALCNATYIFALVKNAEWVKFDFEDQTLKVTKEGLQAWYGKDLSSITTDKDLRNLLQEYLSDKNDIAQFFEK